MMDWNSYRKTADKAAVEVVLLVAGAAVIGIIVSLLERYL